MSSASQQINISTLVTEILTIDPSETDFLFLRFIGAVEVGWGSFVLGSGVKIQPGEVLKLDPKHLRGVHHLYAGARVATTARLSYGMEIIPVPSGAWLPPMIKPFTGVVVTATGVKTLLTVPSGKRWRLKNVYATQATGTFTMNLVGINDGVTTHYLLFVSPSANQVIQEPIPDVVLESGWTIVANVDTKSVDGTLNGSALVDEEDA